MMSKTKKSSAVDELCENCGAPGGRDGVILKKCAKCGLVKYCNRPCHLQHWKRGEHKRFCLTPAERTTKGAEGTTLVSKSADADKKCVICLGSLTSAETVTLPCKHAFHAECVSSMRKLTQNQTCPVCRADLPPGPERAFSEAHRRYLIIERRMIRRGRARDWTTVPKEERDEMDAVIALLRGAAIEGYAEAQNVLGVMLQNGRGVAKDEVEATKWYRKAAEQGLYGAQYLLGVSLMNGRGMAKDVVEAAKWFRKAADQGCVMAQDALRQLGML